MGKDSRRQRSQSEAPSRSRSHHASSSSQQSPSVAYSRGAYRPSRLSHVTNVGDLSDVEAQTEALRRLSLSQEQSASGSAVPLTFDTLSAWVAAGGNVKALDDSILATLLGQYLGPKGERPKRLRYQTPNAIPPPAPPPPAIEEEDEDDGGVSLNEASSSSSRHKNKGKGKAR